MTLRSINLGSRTIVRGRLVEVRGRVLEDVRKQLDAGEPSAAIAVTESEVGKRLGVAVSLLCSEIELAGFRVLHANSPGWSRSHRSEIVVCARDKAA
jgi:hypothetical protein